MAYISKITPLGSNESYDIKARIVETPGLDVMLKTSDSSSNDSGDIVFYYGNNTEKARIWTANEYTAKSGPNYRVYSADGTNLYSGNLVLGDGTGASGTWGISITGNAATASQLYTTGSSGKNYLTGVPEYASKNQTQYVYSPVYMNNGNLYANSIVANDGYLYSIKNSNTVTIGSQNASFCHIYNSANIPFIFNNSVLTTGGNLGDSSYPFDNLTLGRSNGAGIYYKGTNNTYRMIRFIDNTSDIYGNGIAIGGGGQTIIGGGESADTAAAQAGTAGAEIMQVCNDGDVQIISNLQNGWDNRKVLTLNTSGYLWCPGYINVPTGNNENPTISQFIVTNGSDHFYRKASAAHAMAAIRSNASGSWGISITGTSQYLWSGIANPVYGTSRLEYFNSTGTAGTPQANATSYPTSDWYHFLRMNHGNSQGYYVEIASCFHDNNMYWRRTAAGTAYPWCHVWLQGNSVTGAVWNDYAEYREATPDSTTPGYVVFENGDDTLSLTTERLQHFAGITSDTWGFAQGETEKAKTPIAVSGRVLAYTYRDRNEYKPGDCVCAAPGGTIDIMTREEIREWPDRIVGTVSCVPEYDEWGGGELADRPSVKVNGRIWIKVR